MLAISGGTLDVTFGNAGEYDENGNEVDPGNSSDSNGQSGSQD